MATVTSFTPGPNTTLSTALAANRGLRGALHFVMAVPLGWGLLFTLCAAGVGSLLLAWPVLRLGVLMVGVGYLLWLAYKLWQAKALSQTDSTRLSLTFWQGVGLQFMNIKAWMLALSITTGWVAARPDALLRFSLIFVVMMGFAFFSNLSYALMGALLRQWLTQGRKLKLFNRCMAITLVLTACWMLQEIR